jgi:hypothetical protein
MASDGVLKKLYECKPIAAELAGRPTIRWEIDIKEVLRTTKINIWTRCVQDRVKWKEVVEEVNNEVVAPEEEEDEEEVRFSNNTDISLYSGCFIMATYCVFCAVGTEFLCIV